MLAKVQGNAHKGIGAAQQTNQRSLSRIRRKQVPWKSFHELNGDYQPVIGNKYLIARSTGSVESWLLINMDQPTGTLLFVCC